MAGARHKDGAGASSSDEYLREVEAHCQQLERELEDLQQQLQDTTKNSAAEAALAAAKEAAERDTAVANELVETLNAELEV